MSINKILNNNVVKIIKKNNEELVVMVRLLEFQKKKGDEIDDSKYEKIFVWENKIINEKFIALVNDIPEKYLWIVEKIVIYIYTEEKLNFMYDLI